MGSQYSPRSVSHIATLASLPPSLGRLSIFVWEGRGSFLAFCAFRICLSPSAPLCHMLYSTHSLHVGRG